MEYNFEENLNFKKWETRVILFDKIHQFKVLEILKNLQKIFNKH
jgi:hypothetical protein